MAVDDQADQPIPMTVPVALEGDQQPFDLGLGQVLPYPVGIVPPAVLLRDWSLYERFWSAEAVEFCLTFLRPPWSTDRITL